MILKACWLWHKMAKVLERPVLYRLHALHDVELALPEAAPADGSNYRPGTLVLTQCLRCGKGKAVLHTHPGRRTVDYLMARSVAIPQRV